MSVVDRPSYPVVEGAHGLTLFSTWAILMNENAEYASSILGESNDLPLPRTAASREVRLVCTINHEGIHFIQALTTAQAYKYSLGLLSLVRDIIRDGQARRLSRWRIRKHKREYQFLNALLRAEDGGLVTRDLLEAVAVIETYFGTFVGADSSGFDQYLDVFYPSRENPYRRVIGIGREKFGLELALNVLPRLCFLALNSSRPVVTFWRLLAQFEQLPPSVLVRDTAGIAEALGLRLDDWASAIAPARLRSRREIHPYLFPYLERFAEIGAYPELMELASRPSRLVLGEGPPGIAGRILPPALIWHGGAVLWEGIGKEWPDEIKSEFLQITSIAGMCEQFLTDETPYQKCPHRDCPHHAVGFCASWLNIPRAWQDCAFPKAAEVTFGETLTTLYSLLRSERRPHRHFRSWFKRDAP